MAAKFYAVRKGKKPGIYMNWDICKQQTAGFSGAEFKSFPTKEAAEEYISQKQQTVEKEPENYAFVDGSYNIATKVYGYGRWEKRSAARLRLGRRNGFHA